MQRKTFDVILTAIGGAVTIVLFIAGGLMMWGYSFAHSNVHDQLAQQQIFFPPASAFAHPKAGSEITPSMIPSVSKYAGQQVLTGAQAKVYANDFISVHLSEMPYGGVYSKASAAAMAAPNNTQLQNTVSTIFKGTTLRGLLLEAYGFSVMGQIALVSAIVAFAGGLVMLVLTGFGVWHLRKVSPAETLLHEAAAQTVEGAIPAAV
jgi:hypothetical protein